MRIAAHQGMAAAEPSIAREALDFIRSHALPLTGADDDYDALFERIGQARFVLIGEATHGSREFYRQRAAIIPDFLLLSDGVLPASLLEAQLERAIGVVYQPNTERSSHYFEAELFRQFDAVIHLDETRALEPLERTPRWTSGDAPETYPFAL